MKNLTKLVCDLLSAGSQIKNAQSAEQVVNNVKYTAFQCLPEDCDVDLEAVLDHVESMRSAMRGADHDIDKRQTVSIKRITEFHNKLSVHLSDGRELQFNTFDVVHY